MSSNDANGTTEDKESYKSVGGMLQDLLCPDNAKVNTVLDALNQDFMKDKEKREIFVTTGGCFALVLLLTQCLDKAIDSIPACDQVTDVNAVAERLTTLHRTITAINCLTSGHNEAQAGISAIGGVETIVKVMKTFPKCVYLQACACRVLISLACSDIGIEKVIESGGIELLLAAVNNHLVSANICEHACWALINIVMDSKENTELLIALGGAAAVAKVNTEWPDHNNVQEQVRRLNEMIVAEMKD
jgi:hypothetical protein